MSHRFIDPARFSRYFALAGLALLTTLTVALPQGPVSAQAPRTSETRVSLDFVQTDINVVTKALSLQSRANIIVHSAVKGQVTIRLTDVPVSLALRQVAAAVGADVVFADGTYYIGAAADLRTILARGGVRHTLSVRNASPSEVRDTLQQQFPYMVVEQLGRTPILILQGRQEDVNAAIEAAARLDVPAPVAPVTPVIPPAPVRDTFILKTVAPGLAVDTLTRAIAGLKVSAAGSTLVLEGTAEQVALAGRLLAQLDVAPAVAAEPNVIRIVDLRYANATLAAATLKLVFPMGLNITPGLQSDAPAPAAFRPLSVEAATLFGGGGAGGAGATTGGAGAAGAAGARARTLILSGPADLVSQATEIIRTLDIAPRQVVIEARVVDVSPEAIRNLGFNWDFTGTFVTFGEQRGGNRQAISLGRFARSPINFDVAFEALQTRREAKVLARPNLAVVDGEEASIFIGDVLRFERLESVTAVGQTFTIETIPVGVALLVRPRVNADGKVTLRIHPVVSTVTAFVGQNNDIPITATREAESTVIVSDGETFTIGGLLRDEEIKTMSEVPILSKLPLIGELFRNRRTSKRKSEVTIFLTVKLLPQS